MGGTLKLSLEDSPKLDSQGGGKGPCHWELSLFMQVHGGIVNDECLAPTPHEESLALTVWCMSQSCTVLKSDS